MYTQKVLKHFQNPQNMGKIKNPDGVGKVGNIVCGDVMHLYIKVGKNKQGQEIIADIKFQTFGCVAAIATSSTITQLAKGKTLTQALNLNKNQIVKNLGDLPPVKIHCSLLATDALTEAIYDYFRRYKKPVSPELEEKHQRLEKERQLIKEKYKDWVQAEETALEK